MQDPRVLWHTSRANCLNILAHGIAVLLCVLQVLKEPKDVAQQRRDEEAAANAARSAAAAAKADARTKMKGKNKPTRRQKKKQMNIIEERKPSLKAKLAQEVGCDTHRLDHSCDAQWLMHDAACNTVLELLLPCDGGEVCGPCHDLGLDTLSMPPSTVLCLMVSLERALLGPAPLRASAQCSGLDACTQIEAVCVCVRGCGCVLQERERLEATQEAKRQKLESVPRALHRLYQ